MFTKFLISHFIKNYKDISNKQVRENYGLLGGIVGTIVNILLFIIKLVVGITLNSISVIADAFNNFSDIASSIITILGFKLSNKPPDEKHPFGHGRFEYVATMIVSFMIFIVGYEFIKASFKRIINPTEITFETIPFILILLSIAVKVWLGNFYKYLGNKVNSSTLKASSYDSFNDVITSSCVAFSLAASKFTSFPLDGYIGILISLFIIYSSCSLIRETLDPLLGEAPDDELVDNITNEILNYDYISNVHDLIIHNYGPGRCMASIHAEVPCDMSILEIHEIIDKAEKNISKKLNIFLVIHMDPINDNNKKITTIKNEIINITKKYPVIYCIDNFRIIGKDDHKNIIFDVLIDYNEQNINSYEEYKENLKINLLNDIKDIYPLYDITININKL